MMGWITTILASGPARKALGLMLAVLTIVFRNGRSEVKFRKQTNKRHLPGRAALSSLELSRDG